MKNKNKQLVHFLDGFLKAASIVKSPENNKFYGVGFLENKLIDCDLSELLYTRDREINILKKTKRETNLHWLYAAIQNEFDDIENNLNILFIDTIIGYLKRLFRENAPIDVIEYVIYSKITDTEIDYYCEFEYQFYLFQIQNDLIILSFTNRPHPVRSTTENLT